MRGFYRYSIRHPWRVLVVALLATGAVAPGALRLRIRTDGHALVPAEAPEIVLDREIRDRFGLEDQVVVVIESEHSRGIFNADTLRLVAELTEAFREIEGVRATDVFSLATETGHRVKPGSLDFRRFLDPLPTDEKTLITLRDDLRTIGLYSGTLISNDESATTVFVGTPKGTNRADLYRTIHGIIDAHRPFDEKTHVIGAPVAEALLGTHLLEDLGVPPALLGHAPEAGGSDETDMSISAIDALREWIARHVGLVPVAIGVMALVFLVFFRSVVAMALPLAEVGAAIVVVFSLMGWCGVPVYLTIAVLPVILTAIGVADEIHIFARYRDLLLEDGQRSRVEVLDATMSEMWVPVVKTSITTAVGFLSFGLSPIGPVRAFGVFTAVGVVFCMLWSLTVIPALLAVIPERWFVSRKACLRATAAGGLRSFARFGGAVLKARYAVLAMALIVVLAAPWGVRRIVVQDSWIDGFSPSSEFRQATDAFNEAFLGMHILLLQADAGHGHISGSLDEEHVNHHTLSLPGTVADDPSVLTGQHIRIHAVSESEHAGKEGEREARYRDRTTWISDAAFEEAAAAKDPRVVVTLPPQVGSPKLTMQAAKAKQLEYEITPKRFLRPSLIGRMSAMAGFIRGLEAYKVGGVIGPADYIRTTNLIARALKEESRRIPPTPERVRWLWAQYERIRGADRIHQIVSADYDRAITTIFLTDANFVDTARLMDAIRDYEREHLEPEGVELSFAGDVAVSQTLIKAIVKTQTRSLVISLVGILIVASLLGRSVTFGFLAVVPCALAVLVNFAVMGLVGMPLGVATSMFAGMTLGIGVDFAIHLLERYRRARSTGLDVEPAVRDAVAATGPAIMIDAVAVALGFGILTLSQVPANARLGGLVVLSIIGCLAATLLLLPAMLRVVRLRA